MTSLIYRFDSWLLQYRFFQQLLRFREILMVLLAMGIASNLASMLGKKNLSLFILWLILLVAVVYALRLLWSCTRKPDYNYYEEDHE